MTFSSSRFLPNTKYSVPYYFISRKDVTYSLIEKIMSAHEKNDIFTISGIKGMGKTTLLNYLSDYFRNKEGWVVIHSRDKINIQDLIRLIFNESRFNSFLQHVDLDADIHNILSLKNKLKNDFNTDDCYFHTLVKVLSAIRTYKVKILLLLDDISLSEEYHLIKYLRQLPIRMIKTVCSVDLKDLAKIKEKVINFGEIEQLQRLKSDDIVKVYSSELKIGPGNVDILTEAVQGYPLAFQAIGQIVSENKNIKGFEILEKLDSILEENCFSSLRKTLSHNEKKILRCYRDCSSDGIKAIQIRKEIDMSRFSFTKYRSLLIEYGLIENVGRGYTRTVIPRIAENI